MNSEFRRELLPVQHLSFLFAAAFAALVISPAWSAPINYGDFMGTDVWYRQITESANSAGDVPPLFGAPIVSGNSIDFNPIGFNAAAAGPAGNDITDGQLNFMIEAKPGKAITNVWLGESGDTTMVGFGTDATLTLVRSEVFIDILEIDGVSINNINLQDEMTFTPSNGDYFLCADGGCGGFFQADWSGSVGFNINQELTNLGIPFQFGATKVSVALDNTLLALSENGTQSFIAKKDSDGVTIITNVPVVPEPTTGLLAMFGFVAGVLASRRSR